MRTFQTCSTVTSSPFYRSLSKSAAAYQGTKTADLGRPFTPQLVQLKRKSSTSASLTSYSLPSARTVPFSLASFIEPAATRSS